ncbi:hypothetical protein ACQZV8_13415 [Magnetococcales bacterium HHB-1]
MELESALWEQKTRCRLEVDKRIVDTKEEKLEDRAINLQKDLEGEEKGEELDDGTVDIQEDLEGEEKGEELDDGG